LYEGKLLTSSYSIYAAYVTEDGHKIEVGSLFTVKRKQAITFDDIPESALFDGKSVTLNIQGGESNNPVTLTTATSGVCRLYDRTVRFIGQGECVLQAAQDGNEVFADVLVTKRFATKSAGVFSVSANTFDDEMEIMEIMLDLQAPTDDADKPVLFYLKVVSTSNTLMLTENGWAALDQGTEGMPVSSTPTVLPASRRSMVLYHGAVPPAGNYTLDMAYETADQNRTTATSTINVPETETESRQCLTSRRNLDRYSSMIAKLHSREMEAELSSDRQKLKDQQRFILLKKRDAKKEVQMYCIN